MKKKMSNRDKTFWAVVIPVVILFFAFNTLPMIKGVIYSFTNYKGYGTYDYVGFRNYADLFTDSRVGKSYVFTFKYALAGTILVNVLSLIMAVGLNSAIRFKSALRGIYFVPNILGGLVIGYIFSFIFTYILPTVGNVFHIGFLQNSILASEKYAWIGVLIVGVWQAVAMNTIIYISGLQTVPEEVYEASMLDGASKWKQFWKVTFPLVMPFVTINLVLSTKNFLMVFDQIMSLTLKAVMPPAPESGIPVIFLPVLPDAVLFRFLFLRTKSILQSAVQLLHLTWLHAFVPFFCPLFPRLNMYPL